MSREIERERDSGEVPGIERNPDICGGAACVLNTRIPVWLLVQAQRLGSSEETILRAFPSLSSEDLTNVWAYYQAHRGEVERQIEDNEGA